MAAAIVHCISETRHHLTTETKTDLGVVAVHANLDGSPFRDNGVKYPGDHPDLTEVYLDALSGNYFCKVANSRTDQLRRAGVTVFQGVGGVLGWFVAAPDFTVSGRNGGGRPRGAAPVDYPTQQEIEDDDKARKDAAANNGFHQPHASMHNPGPAKGKAKKKAKKAA
jgi:hypothetical protein